MFNRSLSKLIDRLERVHNDFDLFVDRTADAVATNVSKISDIRIAAERSISRIDGQNADLMVELKRATTIRDRVEDFLDSLAESGDDE